MLNLTNLIIAYENGEMCQEEVVDFFQILVDNGLAWKLQGHYGRQAIGLIRDGSISGVIRADFRNDNYGDFDEED